MRTHFVRQYVRQQQVALQPNFMKSFRAVWQEQKQNEMNVPQIQNRIKIAIIGGGASAALLVANLNDIGVNCEVDIYDRSGRFARGVAYSTHRLCHLLNVRASNMSALASDKDHFMKWASLQHNYASHDFVPRKIYGDYLEALLNKAGESITIRKFSNDVKTSRRTQDGFEVEGLTYDFVILASGNVRSLNPKISGQPQSYFSDPWHLPDDLSDMRNIALIGAGLTAVDAMMSLKEIGYKGQVTVFSKNAMLPKIHTHAQTWVLDGYRAGLSPANLMKLIRKNIVLASGQNVVWQAVIDALRPMTNDIWQGWSDEHKASFMRHLYTIWGVHRHRMSPEVASSLDNMSIKFMHRRVNMIDECGVDGQTFDAVINCMGYRYDELDRSFDVSHRIGPARFGALFETTAIPEIRTQAGEIARGLL